MRRLGTLLTFGIAAATTVLAGYGCNGPISDWPPKAGDGNTVSPVTTPGGGSGVVADAGVGSNAGGAAGGIVAGGGTPGGSTPGGLGGLVGGTAAGGTASGGVPGGFLGGGGSGMDAGTSAPVADAGAPPPDSSIPPADAGVDAAAEDAGDAAWPSDGACSFVPVDATAVPDADAGVCAAYGCGVTVDTLSQIAKPGAACAVPEALPFACSGELARAAMICTQENALGLGLGRPVTTCLRRAPQFASVPAACVQCYADESLCTLSRCFVACIDGADPACEQCRRQSCGAPFSSCSGLPQALR